MKQVMAAGKHYMAMKKTDEAGGAAPAPAAAAPAPEASAPDASSSGALGKVTTNSNVSQDYISIRTALADVIQFSGCKDTQTSADAFIEGESCGALSFALEKAFEDFGTDQTYAELLKNIRTTLMGKYSQVSRQESLFILHLFSFSCFCTDSANVDGSSGIVVFSPGGFFSAFSLYPRR